MPGIAGTSSAGSFCVLVSVALLLATSGCQPTEQAGGMEAEYLRADPSSTLPFSDAVRVGPWLFLSGQVGDVGDTLVTGGIGPETRQAMQNISEVLERNGSSMDRVVKCLVMLADIQEWPAMNQEYVTFFPDHLPARSAMGASGLALGARVEIECLATMPPR